MDVSANLASRQTAEAPRLWLAPRRQPLGWAFAIAIALHILAPLGFLLFGPLLLRSLPGSTIVAEPAPLPTPVRVVFYEPAPAATPPVETPEVSDRASRALSEVEPEPGRERLPAARGSTEERVPAAIAEPTPQPPSQPPRPVAQPQPPQPTPPETRELARATPGLVPSRIQVPASPVLPNSAELVARARAARAAAAGETATVAARPDFATAIDTALRASPGYGKAESSVQDTGSLSFDAEDYEWGPYARKVYEIVKSNWQSVIPLAARTPGVTGRVRVRFTILKTGGVQGLELLESAGRSSLDRASLASIEMSDPLPPLPPDFPRDEVGVTFSYFYNMDAE